MERDEQNKVKGALGKGKRNANEINETRGAVFYNPVQEFNRDMSILAINEFNEMLKEEKARKNKEHEGIKVLEALAATGLRSVRYMKEIPSIKKLILNLFCRWPIILSFNGYPLTKKTIFQSTFPIFKYSDRLL